jgi:sphinganine-1-phosphate aldolase
MSVFAYRSKDEKAVNVYAVADFMEQRGWYIDRQQRPACLHLMVNPEHAKVADAYLSDLREAVAWVKAHPEAAQQGKAATYGLIAGLPARDMVAEKVLERMEQMFSAKGAPASL